jgi:transcriptional regulator GlxA family with amidase domain
MESLTAMETTHLKSGKGLSVGFILAPHFTLIALSGFLAVLRQASDVGDKSRQVLCHWTIMQKDLSPVTSSTGVQVIPWETFRDPQAFDYIVIVGGQIDRTMTYDNSLIDYLKRAAGKDVGLIGLCTGSFYLARAGLMKNRKCCVHWYHFHDFIDAFPDLVPVTDELFVVDRNRITCPGGNSTEDLALYLVERHLGKDRMFKCMRHLLLDKGRPHDHPQTPFTEDYTSILDPRVRKTVFLMEQRVGETLSMAQIARQVNTGTRQLQRLFQEHFGKTPAAYFREVRLKYGRWLLLNTDKSITEIAYDCGFADGSHFSRWFKTLFAVSPASIRKQDDK